MPTQPEVLATAIRNMTPPDKLRLAAELLERKQAKLAHSIAERVVLELGAALAIYEMDRRKKGQP